LTDPDSYIHFRNFQFRILHPVSHKIFAFLFSHFTCCTIRTFAFSHFAFSHFAFYTRPKISLKQAKTHSYSMVAIISASRTDENSIISASPAKGSNLNSYRYGSMWSNV